MKKTNRNYLRSFLTKMLLLTGILWLGATSFALAQKTFEYSGKVTNETGETLPGVSVTVSGTTTGSITDLDGNFKFNTDKPAVKLTFSFTGMESVEMDAVAGKPLAVALKEKSTDLEGILVIGYGTQKKSLVTGAISSVKAKELKAAPSPRLDQALQGRVAGLNVNASSGSPGAGMQVRIRGVGSSGNSGPLYIVDGVKSGDITYLEPNDIESIEILKDGASAAIYGSEGSNGVIIITTKSGKDATIEGKGMITYDFQYGSQSFGKMMKVMDNIQYTKYVNEANIGVEIPTDINTNTNWLDEIMQTAPMMKHYLAFQGGNEKSNYAISGSYFNQDGAIGGDKAKFKRYSFRFNGDHQVKKWFKVGNAMSYAHTDRSAISENDEFGGILSAALMLDPLTPVVYEGALTPYVQDKVDQGFHLLKDENGKYYGVSEFLKGESVNPLAKMSITKGKTIQDKLQGNTYAALKPIPGLTITTRASLDFAAQIFHNWSPYSWYSSETYNNNLSKVENYDRWLSWTWDNYAEYVKKIDKNNFTGMIGTSAEDHFHNYLTSYSMGMDQENENFSYHGGAALKGEVSGIKSETTINSYFGRFSYDFDNKYLFSASFRADGSSLFAEGHQWGYFPAVSAGWVLSEEGFWKNLNTPVNYFKVRASWGQNGSLSNLGPDQFRNLIRTSGIQYPKPGGGFYTGAEPELLANPELTWETGEQTDLGLDLRFFKNRLSFTMDYFVKITRNLLTPSTPPLSVGNAAPWVNAGDVTNKGFEFELSYRKTEGDFHYNANVNMTAIKNTVSYLNPLLDGINGAGVGTGWTATYFELDKPVWYFKGYQTNGIFQNDAQIAAYIAENNLTGYAPVPGDPIVVDNKKDGFINSDDMTMIGSPHPDFLFGASFNCDYKNFDLTVFMQGTQGNDILMAWNRTDRGTSNRPEFFFTDRWTGDGSTNSWFRADPSNPFAYNSDLMVFDGSYLRVKQLQLGYTLPKDLASKLRVSNLRVYVSLDDFFTFTNYPGLDPEVGSYDNNAIGVDLGYYPNPRKALFGLSLTL